MAVYVVTGGAGFIGSNIVRRLIADGHEVRVLDDFSTGRRENLAGVEERVLLVEDTITSLDALRRIFRGADYVLHQAALASVARSVEDPIAANHANVEGTLDVLMAARECGVRRVVYASSSSVYGDAPDLPKRETMAPAPRSPYAVSKLAGEHYCRAFTAVYGLETVSLRYFNVFGPRQDPEGEYAAVVPIFVRHMLRGEPLAVSGDGEQSRDFTYVDNAVEANLLAATAPGAAGAVCNIGCGRRYTLNQLIERLSRLIGVTAEPRYGPDRPGDVRHSLADVSEARRVLGYEPAVDFDDGLRRTVDWYQRQFAREAR